MEETEEIECGKLTDWDDCKTTENSEEKKIHYRNIVTTRISNRKYIL